MRIVAENLTFTYNKKSKFDVDALKDISLTIEEGIITWSTVYDDVPISFSKDESGNQKPY